MIRPFTCVCMLLAAGSGLYLYQTKHQGVMLDRQIDQVVHATEETRARIGVLRAEFALLNDPSRLQDLAAQHLPSLGPLQPAQFTTLTELDSRLPPVGAPAEHLPGPPSAPASAPGLAPMAAVAPSTARAAASPPPVLPASGAPAPPGSTGTPSLAEAGSPSPRVQPAIARAEPQAPAGTPVSTALAAAPRPHPAIPRHGRPSLVAARRAVTPNQALVTPASAPVWRTAGETAYAPRRRPPVDAAPVDAAPTGSLLGMARTMGNLSGSAAYLPAAAPGGVSQ